MKMPAVKRMLDIPDVSKLSGTQPDMKVARVNPFSMAIEGVKKELSYNKRAKAEIVDGKKVESVKSGAAAQAASGPPPATFAMPPRKGGKKKKAKR